MVPTGTQANGTQQSTVIEESDEETEKTREPTANLKNYKQFFRELDLDIWIMLSVPLNLNPEPEKVPKNFSSLGFSIENILLIFYPKYPKDWEFNAAFGPSELLFVLEDMVETLQFVLITSSKKLPFKSQANTDIGITCASLYTGAPELIVKNVVKLIPRLCAHLETLAQFCQVFNGVFENKI